MCTIKDQKCLNLKELEDIKEWRHDYIEELSQEFPMT